MLCFTSGVSPRARVFSAADTAARSSGQAYQVNNSAFDASSLDGASSTTLPRGASVSASLPQQALGNALTLETTKNLILKRARLIVDPGKHGTAKHEARAKAAKKDEGDTRRRLGSYSVSKLSLAEVNAVPELGHASKGRAPICYRKSVASILPDTGILPDIHKKALFGQGYHLQDKSGTMRKDWFVANPPSSWARAVPIDDRWCLPKFVCVCVCVCVCACVRVFSGGEGVSLAPTRSHSCHVCMSVCVVVVVCVPCLRVCRRVRQKLLETPYGPYESAGDQLKHLKALENSKSLTSQSNLLDVMERVRRMQLAQYAWGLPLSSTHPACARVLPTFSCALGS